MAIAGLNLVHQLPSNPRGLIEIIVVQKSGTVAKEQRLQEVSKINKL